MGDFIYQLASYPNCTEIVGSFLPHSYCTDIYLLAAALLLVYSNWLSVGARTGNAASGCLQTCPKLRNLQRVPDSLSAPKYIQ